MRELLVTALCLVLMVGASQAQDNRPDVLFISIDDLNDWVEPLGGHPQSITPNLTALAERGMTLPTHILRPLSATHRAPH